MRCMGFWLVATALFVWGSTTSAASLGPDVAGQGPDAVVNVGAGQLAVALELSGVPASGGGLFGWGATVAFDDSVFSLVSVAFGAAWTGQLETSTAPGSVGATANRAGESAGPSGDGIALATLVLAIDPSAALGTYELTLGRYLAAGDNLLFDLTVLDTDAASFFQGGSVTLVPEPGSAGLALVGLLLLWVHRRARQAGLPLSMRSVSTTRGVG